MNYYQTDNYAAQSLDAKVSAVMKSVYVKMFLGLLVTAAVAWSVAATATPGSGFLYYLATHSWLYWALAIVEVGLVLWISAGLRKMSAGMATGLFFLFAVVNGLTLSLIFVVYSLPAIFKTFLITAGVFGAMSVYGYFTNRDLTKIGTYLYMALFRPRHSDGGQHFLGQLHPRLDYKHRRCGALHRHNRLGHPDHQAHGHGRPDNGQRPPRHPRSPQPLPRLHQPFHLPAPHFRQPRLMPGPSAVVYLIIKRPVTASCGGAHVLDGGMHLT